MTLATPPNFRARPFGLVLALAAGVGGWPTASSAQSTAPPPAAPDTIRLTDEQRMAILDGNTLESAAAARGELVGSQRSAGGIHGEVGAMIGSRGTRGVYGTADIPLGDNAGATVSFESSRSNGYRR